MSTDPNNSTNSDSGSEWNLNQSANYDVRDENQASLCFQYFLKAQLAHCQMSVPPALQNMDRPAMYNEFRKIFLKYWEVQGKTIRKEARSFSVEAEFDGERLGALLSPIITEGKNIEECVFGPMVFLVVVTREALKKRPDDESALQWATHFLNKRIWEEIKIKESDWVIELEWWMRNFLKISLAFSFTIGVAIVTLNSLKRLH